MRSLLWNNEPFICSSYGCSRKKNKKTLSDHSDLCFDHIQGFLETVWKSLRPNVAAKLLSEVGYRDYITSVQNALLHDHIFNSFLYVIILCTKIHISKINVKFENPKFADGNIVISIYLKPYFMKSRSFLLYIPFKACRCGTKTLHVGR